MTTKTPWGLGRSHRRWRAERPEGVNLVDEARLVVGERVPGISGGSGGLLICVRRIAQFLAANGNVDGKATSPQAALAVASTALARKAQAACFRALSSAGPRNCIPREKRA